MARTSQEIYSYHVANVRRINTALKKIQFNVRDAISKEDNVTITSFLSLHMLLLGAWAECKLKKLLYEPHGFSDAERNRIILRNNPNQKRTQFEQWEEVINVAFEKHFSILTSTFLTHLPLEDLRKYNELKNLLRTELKPIVEIRNKLAHGQWEYPLNSSGNDISNDFKVSIDSENLLSLQFRGALISSLISIINDLTVSKPTFDRDFRKHYDHIVQTKINLHVKSYPKYASSLVDKKIRGKREKEIRENNKWKADKSYFSKAITQVWKFIRWRFTSHLS